MILAAELAGAFLGGAATAVAGIVLYARRLWRSKMGLLAGQLVAGGAAGTVRPKP